MTHTPGPGGRTLLALVAAVAALGGGPAAAGPDPRVGPVYDRTLMQALGARCGLFSPSVAAALTAGAAQARGAALRAGVAGGEVAAAQSRARVKAGRADCAGAEVRTAAARVRDAFAGYARMQTMIYPGLAAPWTADRAASATMWTWRLRQDARLETGAPLAFGLAGKGPGVALTAAAAFPRGAEPYAARLVMRDPARAATMGRPGQAPAPAASRVLMAAGRDSAAGVLAPGGDAVKGRAPAGALAFRFPVAAQAALGALDPRETVAVEFLSAGPRGDVVRRALIEVGDFAAGRAFLAAGAG